MNKLRFFPLLFILLYSCKKEPVPDYRDNLIGSYNFTCLFERTSFYTPDSFLTKYDTIMYEGTVNKYKDKQLRIIFLDKVTEPQLDALYFPIQINGLIYPVISDSFKLDYPDFTRYSQYYFNGSFFKKDSILIFYGVSLHAGHEENKIYGVKK